MNILSNPFSYLAFAFIGGVLIGWAARPAPKPVVIPPKPACPPPPPQVSPRPIVEHLLTPQETLVMADFLDAARKQPAWSAARVNQMICEITDKCDVPWRGKYKSNVNLHCESNRAVYCIRIEQTDIPAEI